MQGNRNQMTVTIPVSDQFLRDVLGTAIESGWEWFQFSNSCAIPGKYVDEYTEVTVEEIDDDGKVLSTKRVTLDDIARGIYLVIEGKMAEGVDHANVGTSHRAAILQAVMEDDAGHIDANYADCIMQAAVLGKIVYA